MTTDETIGRNVHTLLFDRRMRNKPLYEALGIDRTTLHRKIRGEISWSAQDVAVVAEVLGVEIGRLFDVTRQYGTRVWALAA